MIKKGIAIIATSCLLAACAPQPTTAVQVVPEAGIAASRLNLTVPPPVRGVDVYSDFIPEVRELEEREAHQKVQAVLLEREIQELAEARSKLVNEALEDADKYSKDLAQEKAEAKAKARAETEAKARAEEEARAKTEAVKSAPKPDPSRVKAVQEPIPNSEPTPKKAQEKPAPKPKKVQEKPKQKVSKPASKKAQAKPAPEPKPAPKPAPKPKKYIPQTCKEVWAEAGKYIQTDAHRSCGAVSKLNGETLVAATPQTDGTYVTESGSVRVVVRSGYVGNEKAVGVAVHELAHAAFWNSTQEQQREHARRLGTPMTEYRRGSYNSRPAERYAQGMAVCLGATDSWGKYKPMSCAKVLSAFEALT